MKLRKVGLGILSVFAAIFAAGTSQAGTITVLGTLASSSQVAVFSVNTTSGAATKLFDITNTDYNGNITSTSPNSLGVSGNNYVITTFQGIPGVQERVFVHNGSTNTTTSHLVSTGVVGSIASGDLIGSTYIYSTPDGKLHATSNVFAPTPAYTQTLQVGAGNLGDLALDPTGITLKGYVGHDGAGASVGAISSFDYGTNSVKTVKDSSGVKFLGLGFDGTDLYGVRGNGAGGYALVKVALDTFWSVGAGTTANLAARTVNITGIGRYALTDAASAGGFSSPVPEPFSIVIFGSGLLCMGIVRRKNRTV